MSVAGLVFAPVAAALILFALGLTLEPAALRRLAASPRLLLVGLAARLLVGPLVAVALCLAFRPPPLTALGLLLVAACPFGTPTAALTRAAGGDTALALALTAVTNLASGVTLPLLLLGGTHLAGVGAHLALPGFGGQGLALGALVAVPTLLGMALRRARPALAARLEPRVTPLVLLLLLPVVAVLLFTVRERLGPSLAAAGGLALALNLGSMGLAALLALVARLDAAEGVVVVLGAGLYNFGLASFVSLTLLSEPRVLLPGIAYGLVMLGSAAAVASWAATSCSTFLSSARKVSSAGVRARSRSRTMP